jgi:hypothetical protein
MQLSNSLSLNICEMKHEKLDGPGVALSQVYTGEIYGEQQDTEDGGSSGGCFLGVQVHSIIGSVL